MRARGEERRGGHGSHISGRFTGRSACNDKPRQRKACKGKTKVGDSEVIRKELNERSSFRKERQRAEH